MMPQPGKRIKYAIIASLALIAGLYILQGFLIRYRLNQLGAEKVVFEAPIESCDATNCTASWDFQPQHRFLLLGQILRTHRIAKKSNGEELLPVNDVRGTASDAWSRLWIYKVDPMEHYALTAVKPRAAQIDYFAGVLPRSTNHIGILSIPNIGPTVAAMATSVFLFALVLVCSAAVIAKVGSSSLRQSGKKSPMKGYFLAGFLIAIATCTSLGTFDSFFPEGDFRNKVIRISMLLALLIPIGMQANIIVTRQFKRRILAVAVFGVCLGYLAWPWLRSGPAWAITLAVLGLVGFTHFYHIGQSLVAFLWATAIIDGARIGGLLQFTDYPPIYFFNLCSILSLTILSGNLGGFDTLQLAGRAYRRFRRDMLVDAIKRQIDTAQSQDSSEKIFALKTCLAEISAFTGASRVALAINLPLGRPIILSFDHDEDLSIVYDDGTIPGVVTIRTLLYGDAAYYESFQEFCEKRGLPSQNLKLPCKIFCAIPIKVNGAVIGSMMLTKFRDHRIESGIKSARDLEEEVETLNTVASGFSAALSQLIVDDLDKSTQLSKQLHAAVNREISLSNDADDFIERFGRVIGQICGVQVVMHESVEGRGELKTEAGLSGAARDFFVSNSINLTAKASPALGPTVVALKEGKSSFITDYRQIRRSLHPKTVQILELMGAGSLASVPLRCNDMHFAITVFTSADTAKVGPFIVGLIESTEALFAAALNVMSQKSATAALGALSSRLIGDQDVRNKIVEAAKLKSLPTTIGNPKASFLLLIDLAGSSSLPHDSENKAKAYGYFYNEVNRKANELLSATIRKTIGDAVIVTWDGTDTMFGRDISFLEKLQNLALYADEVARSIGCKGARSILHHGRYFLGLVGTDTFGQIDVIGSGIDEVCKMEGYMKSIVIDGKPAKIAISATAVNRLLGLDAQDFQARKFWDVSAQHKGDFLIRFASTLEGGCANVA